MVLMTFLCLFLGSLGVGDAVSTHWSSLIHSRGSLASQGNTTITFVVRLRCKLDCRILLRRLLKYDR